MNAVVQAIQLPEPVERRGISEAQWRTLANNLFPGADVNSVLMVWDYCIARKLDPLKKPCHIVPMQVKDAKSGNYSWRDVVMPGIYEYRTTANRTGEYLGHSKPIYGPVSDFMGVMAPEWCELTVFRWNKAAEQRCEFPVTVYFSECVATYFDKESRSNKVNSRWTKAPRQMLTKCTESAGLREAFPDELGGTHTSEEMEGQVLDEKPVRVDLGPRSQMSMQESELFEKRFSTVVDILNADKEEHEKAEMMREFVAEYLNPFDALYTAVLDKLARDNVISKANWRKFLAVEVPQS